MATSSSSSSADDNTTSMPTSTSPYHTVAITGASGMLGTALIDELSKMKDGLCGKPIRVVKLQRGDSTEDDELVATNTSSIHTDIDTDTDTNEMVTTSMNWNPHADGSSSSSSAINANALKSIDSLVHLAGENVGSGLLPGPLGWLGIHAWSQKKKDIILSSRVGPTKALASAIAGCETSTNYIVASGVGVYGSDFMEGDDNEESLSSSSSSSPDESTDISHTTGFLADVSREWEGASALPTNSDNRAINLRLAPILSKNGGALGKLYPIFFLGGGGIVGSGKQYFSYISARDAARAIVHVMEKDSLKGPVNLVAPTPATNADFTHALGKILKRPTIIPLPAFAVKLMFGEMGEEMLLGGVKAAPKKLLKSGFEFQHETIEDALQSAVDESI
eukprot:CAMPEP_0194078802 /NCGR_PEP_ID=MMETSP0149-20130528/5114_1 /TAXON_ID=122233 /ORGANISM="Chaetoceros debilis, Strain MM31A-1" /LENGTH=391 /DNA_ID=CAMNT_0038760129 /DNA_START=204 /DNA_END=1379 /DNA_ORIENTATION=-